MPGSPSTELRAEVEAWFHADVEPTICVEGRERIEWHRAAGPHAGAADLGHLLLGRAAAARCSRSRTSCAPQLEIVDGTLTGNYYPPSCFGPGKLRAGLAFAEAHGHRPRALVLLHRQLLGPPDARPSRDTRRSSTPILGSSPGPTRPGSPGSTGTRRARPVPMPMSLRVLRPSHRCMTRARPSRTPPGGARDRATRHRHRRARLDSSGSSRGARRGPRVWGPDRAPDRARRCARARADHRQAGVRSFAVGRSRSRMFAQRRPGARGRAVRRRGGPGRAGDRAAAHVRARALAAGRRAHGLELARSRVRGRNPRPTPMSRPPDPRSGSSTPARPCLGCGPSIATRSVRRRPQPPQRSRIRGPDQGEPHPLRRLGRRCGPGGPRARTPHRARRVRGRDPRAAARSHRGRRGRRCCSTTWTTTRCARRWPSPARSASVGSRSRSAATITLGALAQPRHRSASIWSASGALTHSAPSVDLSLLFEL